MNRVKKKMMLLGLFALASMNVFASNEEENKIFIINNPIEEM